MLSFPLSDRNLFRQKLLDGETPPSNRLGRRLRTGHPSNERYRMTGLKHNPYVGWFHRVPNDVASFSEDSLIMEQNNLDPNVGWFRHSPASVVSSLFSQSLEWTSSLKGQKRKNPGILSQLQVTRAVSLVKLVPAMKYQSSKQSVRSISSESVDSSFFDPLDGEVPKCAICLEIYSDGDELFTLNCSHCFHNECVTQWLRQNCIDQNEQLKACKCPECRQLHEFSDAQMSIVDPSASPKSSARKESFDVGLEIDSPTVMESMCPAASPMQAPSSSSISTSSHLQFSLSSSSSSSSSSFPSPSLQNPSTQSIISENNSDNYDPYNDPVQSPGISFESFSLVARDQLDGGYDFLSDYGNSPLITPTKESDHIEGGKDLVKQVVRKLEENELIHDENVTKNEGMGESTYSFCGVDPDETSE